MSEPVPASLAEALATLQGRLPRVAKDKPGQAGQGRYLYADLTDCTEAIMPLMSALGLSFFAGPTILEDGRFVLGWKLMHSSGKYLEGNYPLPTSGSPQQVGGAITYARRYTLCAVTGLAPGGDDDDAASAEQAHHEGRTFKASGAIHKSPADLEWEARKQPRNVPDAQLAAGGQMTRVQKTAHERLAADTVRDDAGKRAERSHPRGPDPDDPWAQDAPVDHERAAALRVSAEDRPGSLLDSQHRVIERLLGLLGIAADDRAGRHDYVSTLLCLSGADTLASFNDLSYTQAADAIKALQAEQAKEKANA